MKTTCPSTTAERPATGNAFANQVAASIRSAQRKHPEISDVEQARLVAAAAASALLPNAPAKLQAVMHAAFTQAFDVTARYMRKHATNKQAGVH